jgi:hypothetical protein
VTGCATEARDEGRAALSIADVRRRQRRRCARQDVRGQRGGLGLAETEVGHRGAGVDLRRRAQERGERRWEPLARHVIERDAIGHRRSRWQRVAPDAAELCEQTPAEGGVGGRRTGCGVAAQGAQVGGDVVGVGGRSTFEQVRHEPAARPGALRRAQPRCDPSRLEARAGAAQVGATRDAPVGRWGVTRQALRMVEHRLPTPRRLPLVQAGIGLPPGQPHGRDCLRLELTAAPQQAQARIAHGRARVTYAQLVRAFVQARAARGERLTLAHDTGQDRLALDLHLDLARAFTAELVAVADVDLERALEHRPEATRRQARRERRATRHRERHEARDPRIAAGHRAVGGETFEGQSHAGAARWRRRRGGWWQIHLGRRRNDDRLRRRRRPGRDRGRLDPRHSRLARRDRMPHRDGDQQGGNAEQRGHDQRGARQRVRRARRGH